MVLQLRAVAHGAEKALARRVGVVRISLALALAGVRAVVLGIPLPNHVDADRVSGWGARGRRRHAALRPRGRRVARVEY